MPCWFIVQPRAVSGGDRDKRLQRCSFHWLKFSWPSSLTMVEGLYLVILNSLLLPWL